MPIRLIRSAIFGTIALLFAAQLALADSVEPEIRHGQVNFEPVANESNVVPEPFRLPAQVFAFEQKPQGGWGDEVAVSLVTFPSPVKTPYENNNTVHCEYFRPAKPGKYPACIVLHILGGDFPLARAFADNLARHGVAALICEDAVLRRAARSESADPHGLDQPGRNRRRHDTSRKRHPLCHSVVGKSG